MAHVHSGVHLLRENTFNRSTKKSLSKNMKFAATPLVLTPFVRSQQAQASSAGRAAKQPRQAASICCTILVYVLDWVILVMIVCYTRTSICYTMIIVYISLGNTQ